ncbi:MAG: antibiotic biosynthesis monooxygenase [Oceanospirillaceae bacterium]|nr:antibiotic biosynthesis monooxygenase [Oceanospirillaceae bacterium]NRB41996.1 antibiotic biosynthesis monooxygenase [Pseudomonadales bacterium]
MINVIASIKVKPAQLASFITIFKANTPKVLEEQGCIEYAAKVDFETQIPIQEIDLCTVTIIEKWQSIDHLHAHLQAPHMLAYKVEVADMVEAVSLKILQDA